MSSPYQVLHYLSLFVQLASCHLLSFIFTVAFALLRGDLAYIGKPALRQPLIFTPPSTLCNPAATRLSVWDGR